METEFELRGYTVKIEPDNDATPPDDWNDRDFIATTRNRYFEKKGPNGEDASEVDENREELEKDYHIFPLYMYQHSGTALSLTPFSCPWDSGQVGFLLVSKNDLPEGLENKQAECIIEQWNQYLSGDIWGYIIEDGDGGEIDSCWGFYGFDYCKEEAISNVPDATFVGKDNDETDD